MNIRNKTANWLAAASLCSLSTFADATSVTFTPMDNLSITNVAPSKIASTRTMAVTDSGKVMAIDAVENVIIWSTADTVLLGNHDCDNGSTAEPTNMVYLSNDAQQALWRCRDNGLTKLSRWNGSDYTTNNVGVSGTSITNPAMNAHIASKDANVFNLDPHQVSQPRQGETRVAVQVQTGAFQELYLEDPVNRGQVQAYSPNGRYAGVSAASGDYIVDLNDLSATLISADFAYISSVSNDGTTAAGTTNYQCYYYCSGQAQIWNAESGSIPLNQDANLVQDMAADGNSALLVHTPFSQGSTPSYYLWTAYSGVTEFETFVMQHGGNLNGWSDLKPIAMSQNGLYIVGVGTNANGESDKGFMIEIDPSGECTYTY